MRRWLLNVAEVQSLCASDLLLIDNSRGTHYAEKLSKYCEEVGVSNYKIDHFEVQNADLKPDNTRSINVEISQEIIRQKALKKKYDAWFSWECDQIIPADSLCKLAEIMTLNNYMIVAANSWARTIPGELNTNMGITLISKEALKIGWFLPFPKGKISFNASDFYNVDESMFKKRVLKNGGNYIELFGVINPVFHLDK